MKLTKQEVRALRLYLDETTINITSLIKKIGVINVREFEKVIHKIYKEDDRAAQYING
jgi:hypothetical protein